MPLSDAEVARTVAAGRLPGRLAVTCRPHPLEVRHAVDRDGRVLILAALGSDVARVLVTARGLDAAAVLAVDDVPPFAGGPSRGRVMISGWVRRLADGPARRAALAFAEANPVDDLLDVGRGHLLFKLDPEEVRLGTGVCVPPEAFAAAEPDPFHEAERQVLLDLADHHSAEVGQRFGPNSRVVRIDRYGVVVVVDGELRRYEFPHPALGVCCLSKVLRLAR